MRLLLLSVVLAFVAADEPEVKAPALNSARVVIHKASQSQYAVQNMDYVMEYVLHNLGDQAALQVVLDDRNAFPTHLFEIVKGVLHVRYEKIAPGDTITHAVVVRPRTAGIHNHTFATLTYLPSETAKETRIVESNFLGEGQIYLQKEYERKFGSKLLNYVFFVIFAVSMISLPYYMWNQVAKRYSSNSNSVRKQK